MHIMLEYVSTIDVAGMHFRARWQVLGRSSVGWCTPLMKLMWLRECVMRSPRISLNPKRSYSVARSVRKDLRRLPMRQVNPPARVMGKSGINID